MFGSLPFLAFCVGLGSGLIWGSLGFWMGFWRGAVGILELKTAKPKWRGAAGGDSPLRPGAFHSPRELPSPPRQPGGTRHCPHGPQEVSLGFFNAQFWGFIFYVPLPPGSRREFAIAPIAPQAAGGNSPLPPLPPGSSIGFFFNT